MVTGVKKHKGEGESEVLCVCDLANKIQQGVLIDSQYKLSISTKGVG